MACGLTFRHPLLADIYRGKPTNFSARVVSVAAASARGRPAAVILAVALLTFA